MNALFSSTLDYAALGDRVRAYRMGASMQAEGLAEQLGVSRSVVYRMEKGQFVKIETLERLARLLGTSLASLLGVEVEYYASALAFIERMRQLEEKSTRILAHFEPVSLLLLSDEYVHFLRLMLREARTNSAPSTANDDEIEGILSVLHERKTAFLRRRLSIVSLIGLRDLERFAYTGLVGHLDLPEEVRQERVAAAYREIKHIADLMESDPLHIQIGLIDDAMPASTFQLFMGEKTAFVATSPFRFGELPNIRNGIATVTASPESVTQHEAMIGKLWQSAYKGKAGAARLRKLLNNQREP